MTGNRRKRLLGAVLVLLLGGVVVLLGPALSKMDLGAIGTRASWQLPERVVQTLALEPGAFVADIGAGDGYFTFYLADAVSNSGRVFAVEIDTEIVNRLREAAKEKGANNIEAVLAEVDDPGLADGSIDLAFFCNVYHHIEARDLYFKALRRDLAPGGRVAIIEIADRAPLKWLSPPGHSTSLESLESEMTEAGYRLVERHDFLPLQNFVLFESSGSVP